MKIFVTYCPFGFSNCYILGTDALDDESPRDAIVVDPGSVEQPMLGFIEKHDYTVRGILVTHDHIGHVHGLRTLKRIYDAEIYAVSPMVREYKTRILKDGEILHLGSIDAEVITVPGHSSDSVVFRVGHTLFTGDAISAGNVGSTISSYGMTIQINALRSKVLSLPGDHILLPGHGPPTSLDAERQFNAGIQEYDLFKTRRKKFRIDTSFE
ncbi:MAG: MBL fold metallo-hydrolase [Treponema sp.]|jgi:glyoxylase-like metal-dependent hydrolase (beta-lactamase superfamily II)|nr:MBL fold metallo-hydrolase [Treponema sp.]